MAKKKAQAQTDNSNKPWVSNYPALQQWLDDHEAQCAWQLPMGDPDAPSTYVEAWQFSNGRIATITIHGNRSGWNIYTPHPSNLTADSLADAEKRLGLAKPQKEGQS